MSVEINSNVPIMTNEKEPIEVASEGSDLFKSVKIESTGGLEIFGQRLKYSDDF